MNNIDQPILSYLKDGIPEDLDQFIISPTQIIDSTILPDNHELINEAIVILDSLNSYNNSLSNEENEEYLLEIPENSPLYSYRCGVLAIKEFYNQNQNLVTEYLNEIRINSPVKKLSNYILKNKETALFAQNKNINNSVDALKEVIQNSLVDIYPNSVKMLLDDLKDTDPKQMEDSVLTIIEESLDSIPLEVIHQSIVNYFPICESTRLMALGSMYKFPIKSLGYLFSYTNLSEFSDVNSENFKALLVIIKEMVIALIKEKYSFSDSDEKEQFRNESNIFIHILKDLYHLEYKESKNPLTNLRRALNIKIDNKTITKQKPVHTPDMIQGDLFSE